MINHLLVSRLRESCDLASHEALLADVSWIDTVQPLARFREETRRGLVYHRRRVRHFVNELRAGRALDPIEVDNVCGHNCIYAEPLLIDGNHRLLAHVIAGKERVPAIYSGRVDLLRYLEGKRKSRPE